MIDRLFYKFFGMIDNICVYLFDRFISDAPKKKVKKKSKPSNEDLFNGE